MKTSIILLHVSAYFLMVSFKKEDNIRQFHPATISDTIASKMPIKLKLTAANKPTDSINHSGSSDLIPGLGYYPIDPDETLPPATATDSNATHRAREQMKAYLDSLIIDPRSADLKMEKAVLYNEASRSKTNQVDVLKQLHKIIRPLAP
jgi:hypothetical protein